MGGDKKTGRKVNWEPENPFDAIATQVKVTKSKTTKLVATVTEEIRDAVDRFIGKKATLAAVKAEVEQLDTQIIDHVREQQERLARAGNYSKSFEVHGRPHLVEGNNIPVEDILTYTTPDKFSPPKDPESQAQLKNLLGERFKDMFAVKRTITLKPTVLADKEFIQKLAAALATAEINLAETFDVVDVLEAKEDLDKKQYDLPPRELEVFKTHVKQTKPSLR
jgi:hypothetical protein